MPQPPLAMTIWRNHLNNTINTNNNVYHECCDQFSTPFVPLSEPRPYREIASGDDCVFFNLTVGVSAE